MSIPETSVWPSLPVNLKTQLKTELTQLLSEALHERCSDPAVPPAQESGHLFELAMGQIGIVLSYESARLSRDCSDWYPLLDLCPLNQCLIGDRDGVYDPSTPNGRLLLGMKGRVSELSASPAHQRSGPPYLQGRRRTARVPAQSARPMGFSQRRSRRPARSGRRRARPRHLRQERQALRATRSGEHRPHRRLEQALGLDKSQPLAQLSADPLIATLPPKCWRA